MAITITTGWWLLPLAITIAAFVWGGWLANRDGGSSGYADGILGAFVYGAALIVSLIAWLVWAVL